MPTVWFSYAWADNRNEEADAIIDAIRAEGVEVLYDRVAIPAGQSLWQHIGDRISNDPAVDAWVYLITRNSLNSGACLEELDYATIRAVQTRGAAFPLIGLVNEPIDFQVLPPALRARRCVDTRERDWARVIARGAVGEAPGPAPAVEAIDVRRHETPFGLAYEFRPRVGVWFPVRIGVPAAEAEMMMTPGIHQAGAPPRPGPVFHMMRQAQVAVLGQVFQVFEFENDVGGRRSVSLFLRERPSAVVVGAHDDGYLVRLLGNDEFEITPLAP